MRKSLFFTLEFPPDIGGVASYYGQLCQQLPAHDLVVVAPTSKSPATNTRYPIIRTKILEQLRDAHQSLFGIKQFKSLINHYRALQLVQTIQRQQHIKLIHVGQLLPLGSIAYVNWRKTKTPYFIYAHGLDVLATQHSWRKKKLAAKILKHAEYVIVNSHFTKIACIAAGARAEAITILHPGSNVQPHHIDTNIIIQLRQQYHLQNKKIIITVGRLVKRKGHDKVLEALPQIIAQQPDTHYVIIGSGPERQRLQDLVAHYHLHHHVTFISQLNPSELHTWYQASEVFIMPSRQIGSDVEGFGIVYLEANLFGKPVIAGNSGGIPDAVIDGQTGLLVDPNDVESIARATCRLLQDPAYAATLGIQGMDRVMTQFDWPSRGRIIQTLSNEEHANH